MACSEKNVSMINNWCDCNIQVVRNLDIKFGCFVYMHDMVYISCKES
jgi:hypothetical protein